MWLFCFFGCSKDPKEVIGFPLVVLTKKGTQESHKNDEPQDHHQLRRRGLLDGLSRLAFANLPRAILGLPFIEKGIEFTSQTNAEGRLEKEKEQTDKADDSGNRTVGVDHDHKSKHSSGQRHADDPGESFLLCADVLRCLPGNDESADDQRRREFWIDKNPDNKIGEEKRDHVFDRHEIIVEHDKHEREEGRDEEETRCRPDLPFVQYPDVVAGDVFPELYCFTHGSFFS